MERTPKILRFTRREASYDGPENALISADLKRAAEHFPPNECVPESVWRAASSLQHELSRALTFSTKCSHLEAMRENLRRYPFLRLGMTRYMTDDQFPDVEFLDAEAHDDARV